MSELYDDEYDMSDLVPGKKKNKKSKKEDIMKQLREIEQDDYVPSGMTMTSSFLPSSMLKEQDKKSSKKEESTYEDSDTWFNDLLAFSPKLSKNRGKIGNDLFESAGIKGKKKKKKKNGKDDLVDYKREFEPEMALYKNLLMEQNRFAESLQKEYDQLTSSKSSSRGISKTMTDLVSNITSARTLAMQLVEKNVNAKKLIADLSLKQKKELGGAGDGENMADFASSYLKQMLNDRGALMGGTSNASITEYESDEDLFAELGNTIISNDDMDEDRSEDVEKFLKYENSNVTIYVVITDNNVDDYEFVAKDENGKIIDDYPLPLKTSISINRSTNTATDTYGKKYFIIWN